MDWIDRDVSRITKHIMHVNAVSGNSPKTSGPFFVCVVYFQEEGGFLPPSIGEGIAK